MNHGPASYLAPSPAERAVAVSVNVTLYGMVAGSLGAPRVVGVVLAAIAMALAVDERVSPGWRKIGGLLAAPGAVAVSVLREQGVLLDPPSEPPPPTATWAKE